MDEGTQHKSRSTRRSNALLSSYYRTSPRLGVETGTGGEAEIGPAEEELADGGKAAAHKYAAELIQTLPLSRLLVCSTQLRKEAREVEAGLHRIVQESYMKFQAAAGVVGEISTCSGSMEKDIDALLCTVKAVETRTEKVNARLAEGRERVEQLEGARRVLQILRAARQLPARMRKLHECGDTTEAARRYSLILPSLTRLEKTHEPFQDAMREIESAAAEIRHSVAERMNEEGGMDPGEAVRLRVQLGESPDLMKEAFLMSSAARVMGTASEYEIGVAHASEALLFFTELVLPLIAESAQSFSKMFPEDAILFSNWVVQVVDEAVSIRVRRCLPGSQDIDLSSIERLVEMANVAKKKSKEVVATCDFEALSRSLLSETEIACNGVLSEAHAATYAHLERDLSMTVDDVVSGKRSVHTLLPELNTKIGAATDSAAVLEKAIGIRGRAMATEGTDLVTMAVMKRLNQLLTSSPEQRNARDLLVGARICSTLEGEPKFRRAKPGELGPRLAREYAIRQAATIADPLRSTGYQQTPSEDVGALLRATLAEVTDVFEDDKRSTSLNNQGGDRRMHGRRIALTPETDLGSLDISVGTTMEPESPGIIRTILSSLFKSWIEYLRGVDIDSSGLKLVDNDCTKIMDVVLSTFPGSGEGLREAVQRVQTTAKERVRK